MAARSDARGDRRIPSPGGGWLGRPGPSGPRRSEKREAARGRRQARPMQALQALDTRRGVPHVGRTGPPLVPNSIETDLSEPPSCKGAARLARGCVRRGRASHVVFQPPGEERLWRPAPLSLRLIFVTFRDKIYVDQLFPITYPTYVQHHDHFWVVICEKGCDLPIGEVWLTSVDRRITRGRKRRMEGGLRTVVSSDCDVVLGDRRPLWLSSS